MHGAAANQGAVEALRRAYRAVQQDLVTETARVLALVVAGYQAKFAEIPVEESLRLLRVETLNDEDARMLASGLETLVGVLGALREDMRKGRRSRTASLTKGSGEDVPGHRPPRRYRRLYRTLCRTRRTRVYGLRLSNHCH